MFTPEFVGMRKGEIKDNLDGVSCKIQAGNYTRQLTQEEIDEKKTQLSDVCISINKLEIEKKEVMDDFKDRLKEPKATQSELLKNIEFKSVSENGNLYHIDDQEEGMMYIFSEEGICVDARALTPSERQTSIRKLNQEAI